MNCRNRSAAILIKLSFTVMTTGLPLAGEDGRVIVELRDPGGYSLDDARVELTPLGGSPDDTISWRRIVALTRST